MEMVEVIERGLKAAISMFVSLILWYFIPSVLLQAVVTPSPMVGEGGYLAFALLIGSLSALGYAFQDSPLGLVCGVGSNLATATFLYLAASGGVLTFEQGGMTVAADFQPLLYLLIAPSVLSMVRRVWGAISESVGRPSSWTYTGS